MQDKYMTIKEAASFANKSTNTIRRAIKKGTLTARLIKGKYFILASSVISTYGLTQEMVTPLVATPLVATQEVVTQSVATQESPTQSAPTQELPTPLAPTQEVPTPLVAPTQEVPTPLVATQELPTQSVPTPLVPTQELLTQDNDQRLAHDVAAHDHNPAYPLFNLIEVLKAELRVKNQQLKAKDEQLRAKDEQIAQLMHVLQSTMGLIKQLPAATEPEPKPEPEAAPKGKGFWATVRKRLRR